MSHVRFRKLFISGLFSGITEQDIKEYFAQFGTITACSLHKDHRTGRFRGFGFITFEQPASVDAVQESRPHSVKGCKVTLKRAVPKELLQEYDAMSTVNRLFVGGLKQKIQESHIAEYFSSFGTVRKVDIMVNRITNTKRGFAFVEFEDYDPVDKAVLQGRHHILGTQVTVRKAKSIAEMEFLRMT